MICRVYECACTIVYQSVRRNSVRDGVLTRLGAASAPSDCVCVCVKRPLKVEKHGHWRALHTKHHHKSVWECHAGHVWHQRLTALLRNLSSSQWAKTIVTNKKRKRVLNGRGLLRTRAFPDGTRARRCAEVKRECLREHMCKYQRFQRDNGKPITANKLLRLRRNA